jgi:ribosome-binding ATPase YchF (GTP1/OBG family)
VTIKEAFKLITNTEDNPELLEEKAKRALFKYYKQHEFTISQKVDMIMDNFLNNGRKKINGHGKAMIVTDSRQRAVLYYQAVKEYAENEGSQYIAISANIESELSELPLEEKLEYLNSLGATATGLDRLVATTYKLLNLATFFTVGPDEVRAWTFTKGMTAPQCAGTIHTDFEKGFIRAEVYSCDDIFELKSEKALREAGKIRSEGKTYLVQDGDCLLIRFNV